MDKNDGVCMFDVLADEVLLIILGYLSTKDRWSISRTCQRFHSIYSEKKLWTRADVPFEMEHHDTIEYILKSCINSRTSFLRICGTSHGSQGANRTSLTPSLLLGAICNGREYGEIEKALSSEGDYVDSAEDSDDCPRNLKRRKLAPDSPSTSSSSKSSEPSPRIVDKCTSLVELHLVKQKIDGRYLNLRDLPSSLRVLNLSGTHVSFATEELGYFRDISFTLVNLEDLNLTDCTWITSHALLALSKLPSLLKISLRGCRCIGNYIAYVSLAMRLGFKKLKLLDVTNTRFRGPDIDCASYLPCLEEFYVGEYDKVDPSIDYYSFSMDNNFAYFGLSETLKVIDISGCIVTDNVLQTFSSLPNITKIIAHFTGLTEFGIEQFKKIKPSCILEKEEEYCEPGF